MITHEQLRVRSGEDALKIIYLVERGLLPLVTRRTDEAQRSRITHGSVFCWRSPMKGAAHGPEGKPLERWTDGKSWGPSNNREDFLIYREKDTYPSFIKSCYTAINPAKGDYKYHLVAYYSEHGGDLPCLDNFAHLADYAATMPPGYFRPGRKEKKKSSIKKKGHAAPDSTAPHPAAIPSTSSVLLHPVNALASPSPPSPRHLSPYSQSARPRLTISTSDSLIESPRRPSLVTRTSDNSFRHRHQYSHHKHMTGVDLDYSSSSSFAMSSSDGSPSPMDYEPAAVVALPSIDPVGGPFHRRPGGGPGVSPVLSLPPVSAFNMPVKGKAPFTSVVKAAERIPLALPRVGRKSSPGADDADDEMEDERERRVEDERALQKLSTQWREWLF